VARIKQIVSCHDQLTQFETELLPPGQRVEAVSRVSNDPRS